MATVLTIRTDDDLAELEARLAAPEPVLDAIGGILKSISLGAFNAQKFGSFNWPARYAGQGDPFINVAGALTDLAKGPSVKSRRFDKRPAGIDSGRLMQSIEHSVVSKDTVAVKALAEYAGKFQRGGKSTIPITDATKENLAKWLKKTDRSIKKHRSKLGKEFSLSLDNPFRKRFGFAFNVDEYEIESIPRPFIGITDEGEDDSRATIEEWAAATGGF